jgi:hypothetical protein
MFYFSDPLASSHKIWWADNSMKFDGVPYMILGTKIFDCAQGKDRKEKMKKKMKLMRQVQKLHVLYRSIAPVPFRFFL